MTEPGVEVERARLAEDLLQEAVYRARETQGAPFSGGDGAGACGLGERAGTLARELSPRAREIAERLWPAGLSPSAAERVHAALQEWVEHADALDRERNHFLKAFRRAHGFDRARYTPAQLAEYEAGLETINAEVRREHAAAARALLAIV